MRTMATVRFEETSRWRVEGSREPFEEVRGRFHVSIDPRHTVNQKVRGIGYFPAGQQIECEADALFIVPSSQQATTCVVLDIPNRGLPLSWFICNQAPLGRLDKPLPIGDGYTCRKGIAFATCGWQSCLIARPGLYSLRAPLAVGADGTPLTGTAMCEFDTSSCHLEFPGLPEPDRRCLRLGGRGHLIMTAAGTDQEKARLFKAKAPNDREPEEIARHLWRFGSYNADGAFEEGEDSICMEQGFEKGSIYRLCFTSKRAIVTGLQQIVIREFAAWVKYAGGVYGTPPSSPVPLIAVGGSQSGRFLRTWIADDFIVDQHGRDVVDGISVWVAGSSRGQFNQLFGQASMALPHLAADRFPFSPVTSSDGEESGGIHDKVRHRGSLVKVIYTNTSIEYHRGDASLLHTTPDGKEDLLVDEHDTRVYLLAGCPHNPTASWPPSYADGMPPGVMVQQNLTLNHSFAPVYRHQVLLLLGWIRDGTHPPPSCHPRLVDSTLVSHAQAYAFFDTVPSACPPGKSERAAGIAEDAILSYSRLFQRDFGLSLDGWCTILPPSDGAVYGGSLVPAVNENGIDKAAIHIPTVAAPLCSYVGWALRHPNFGGEANIMMVSGASIPFSKNKEERESFGDPRISAQERYSSCDEYVAQVLEAAVGLAEARFISNDDVELFRAIATQTWEWFVSLPSLQ